MITYDPTDPTTEIIFNLSAIALEARNLVTPDASFILGEWVSLGANETAVKITGTGFVLPRMVYTSTDRHDVTESEKITVVAGFHHLSTMNYKTGESFAVGSQLVALADAGIGKLAKLPAAAGTYYIVGQVRKAPAVDGTSRLIAEIKADPQIIVVP